jgi:hypothetical protein
VFVVVNLEYVLKFVHADGHWLDAGHRNLFKSLILVDLFDILDRLFRSLINLVLNLV